MRSAVASSASNFWGPRRGYNSMRRSRDARILPPRAAEFAYADRKMPVTEKAAHLRGLSRGLLTRVLDVADRASAAFSIEARYPFFDRRLIEFCLGVPANQKLRDGWTRWIMRQAMDGSLPAKISGAAEKAISDPISSTPYIRSIAIGWPRSSTAPGDRLAEYPRHEGVAHANSTGLSPKNDVRRTSRHARSDPRRVASPHRALARGAARRRRYPRRCCGFHAGAQGA